MGLCVSDLWALAKQPICTKYEYVIVSLCANTCVCWCVSCLFSGCMSWMDVVVFFSNGNFVSNRLQTLCQDLNGQRFCKAHFSVCMWCLADLSRSQGDSPGVKSGAPGRSCQDSCLIWCKDRLKDLKGPRPTWLFTPSSVFSASGKPHGSKPRHNRQLELNSDSWCFYV